MPGLSHKRDSTLTLHGNIHEIKKINIDPYILIRYGDINRIKELIEHGIVDINLEAQHGKTLIHSAIYYGRIEVVKYLLDMGASIQHMQYADESLLHTAIKYCHSDIEVFKLLIQKGADINAREPYYLAPLELAARYGRVEIAKLLVDNGAQLSKSWALHESLVSVESSQENSIEIIKYLIDNGIEVTSSDVLMAIKQGYVSVVNSLMNKTDLTKYGGLYASHIIYSNSFDDDTKLEMIKSLLSRGITIDDNINTGGGCTMTLLREIKQYGAPKKIAEYLDSKISNLSHSKIISFDNADINIKYNLAGNKLDQIEASIRDAIHGFKGAFDITPSHREINVYVFDNLKDFRDYQKKIGAQLSLDAVGRTYAINKGKGADVYIFLDSKGNIKLDTLEHEIGHAMQFTNSGVLSNVITIPMREGIANYTAGLKDGSHVNDYVDKKALAEIENKNLKPDEILRDNNRGNYYYSEAEQVVKFLEYKHPELIDNLLKSLSAYERHDELQANKLVEDFLTNLKGYDQEFREWIQVQLSDKEYLKYEDRVSSIQDDKAEQSDNEERKMSKRSIKEDKVKQEEISVIDSTEDDAEKDLNHSLKVKMDKPVPEKLSNKFEEGSNQVGAKLTINNEKVDEEIVAENEIKSKKKEVDKEDKGDTEESNNSLNTQTNNEDEIVELQEGSMLQEAQERTAILIVEIDNLLKSLSNYEYHNIGQSKKSIEDFLVKLEGYTQELKNWIKDELNSEGHKYVKANQPDYSNEVQDESVSQEIPQNVGLYGYSSVNHISSDKIKVEAKSSISRENDMQADQSASEERSKRLIREDEEKQEKTTIIDNVNGNQEELQHSLKIKMGEAIGGGKYKVVLQAQDQDIDNFYQNLSSNYTAGKYNHDQMIALYDKVYIQDSKLDGKPITLSEAYVTDDHLFIKNQDFGILNDFNEMFYKSDVFM